MPSTTPTASPASTSPIGNGPTAGRDPASLTGSSSRAETARFFPASTYFFFAFIASVSSAGYDFNSTNVSGGGCTPVCSALTTISTATAVVVRATTVAVSSPRFTQTCPSSGRPSTPVTGTASQRSRSSVELISRNAFLAPAAIPSYWQPTTSIDSGREVDKRSQACTAS